MKSIKKHKDFEDLNIKIEYLVQHAQKHADNFLRATVKSRDIAIFTSVFILITIILIIIAIAMVIMRALSKAEKDKKVFLEEIEAKNRDLEHTQKIAKLGKWTLDVKNNVLTWDEETYKIFDMDPKYAIASIDDFFDSIHPSDIQKVSDTYTQHLLTKEPYVTVHRLKTKLGKIKYVEERCETVFDEDSNPLTSYGIIHDITYIREKDEALKKQEVLLMHQSRLAQMGEMISMIAHQWRQPLGIISAIANNVQLRLELNTFDTSTKEGVAKQCDFIEEEFKSISRNVQSLSGIIDNFRDFYKPNKSSVMVSTAAVVQKSIDMIKAALVEDNIEISAVYNSHYEIELYDSEIIHVILNILQNSHDNFLDKAVKGAKIVIMVESTKILIQDNGGGIPKNIIGKIYDPYFSTKKTKNGNGLGLYMSQTIIEKHHDGILRALNRDDGVCFYIEIGKGIQK